MKRLTSHWYEILKAELDRKTEIIDLTGFKVVFSTRQACNNSKQQICHLLLTVLPFVCFRSKHTFLPVKM